MELEINLESGSVAVLKIFNEEKFEEEVLEFCKENKLDDIKRKKLMKLVKVQLIEMVENGELGDEGLTSR